jgi:hypothetical protein
MEEMRNAYRIFIGNLNGGDNLENLGADGRILCGDRRIRIVPP